METYYQQTVESPQAIEHYRSGSDVMSEEFAKPYTKG